jgi:hypothetical protein
MTDVAYRCHNCGSMHEVEPIRENLILDLRTVASYESGQRDIPGPRTRLLRWRMTRGLARALWPDYPRHPWLAWGRRLVQGPQEQVSDRIVPCRAATGGSDARAAPERRARKAPPGLARLVVTLLAIRGPLRRVTWIQHCSALRYK